MSRAEQLVELGQSLVDGLHGVTPVPGKNPRANARKTAGRWFPVLPWLLSPPLEAPAVFLPAGAVALAHCWRMLGRGRAPSFASVFS